MRPPNRAEEALRRGRVSAHGASYFLTLCVENRVMELTEGRTHSTIHHEIFAIESDAHWRLRAAVLMPDHVHLLVCLTGMLPIQRCVARLKSKTKAALDNSHLAWQRNFYERRIRADDPVQEVIRYIFLNPYRASLLQNQEKYPWFWLGAEEARWFEPITNDARPFPEWLR